jgi:ketosteroid isomerase-like protein
MKSSQIEDQLALKKLVDTFSNLADLKDVKSQMNLFTDDAQVISKTNNQNFESKGKKEIEKAFADYLALFDIVYHLNGQQTVEIKGDHATGISYCFVTLIGKGKKNQSGVRYNDTYVKISALKEQNNSKIASEQLINFSFFSAGNLIHWISDIYVARYVILASVIWSFLLAMIFLLFLRCCAGVIVFIILIGIFIGLVIVAVLMRFKMNDYKDEGDETKEILFCVLFWVCVVLALIWLLFVIIMCNRIRLSIALIQIASKYINSNCSILWIPFLFFIITIVWIAYWIILSVYLYSSGKFNKEKSHIFASFDSEYNFRYLWWYHLFALFYIDAFISAFSQFIYASSASIWYFNNDKGTEGHFILKSFKWAFRYHFGSIAFGSLIIAIVRFLMLIFEVFKKKWKNHSVQKILENVVNALYVV